MPTYKLFLFLVLGFIIHTTTGQSHLSESKPFGENISIYQLNPDDLKQIYLRKEKMDEKFLHHYISQYPHEAKIPDLPRGNYLLVQAVNNQLIYNSHTVDNLQYQFLQGPHLSLYLYTREGETIRNAKISLGKKQFIFNPATSLYTINKTGKNNILVIEHQGVYHHIDLHKYSTTDRRSRLKNFWHRLKVPGSPNHTGFIVFNKPKYKPHETVKLKAYVASTSGKPYNKPLALSLYNRLIPDTILAILSPYRPGMFSTEFELKDSLQFKTDQSYLLKLIHPKNKKSYLARNFSIENYELKNIDFTVECAKNSFQKGESPLIKLKATDENGLALSEGTYQIEIIPDQNYTFLSHEGFLPDKLWTCQIACDQPSEKQISIPDHIFPADVSFNFRIHCTYLNGDNQKLEKNLNLYYQGGDHILKFTETATGILIHESYNGTDKSTNAQLRAFSKDGGLILEKTIHLPFNLELSQNISYYTAKTAHSLQTYYLNDYTKELIKSEFHKENGQLTLEVQNPSNFLFWYSIWQNSKLIAQGYTKQLNFRQAAKENDSYRMQIEYLFADRLMALSDEITPADKQIDIHISTPPIVYPGQTTNLDIQLTNSEGQPVTNADFTAYAYTSKLSDYPPFIPSWSSQPKDKRNFIRIYPQKQAIRKATSKLNWENRKKEMGLDGLVYYHFLHPSPLYLTREECPNQITQIVPHALIQGDVQGIYLIRIDNLPYFYAGATHAPAYSFPVTPGKHTIYLRTFDREIKIDSLYIEEGKKTILSVNAEKSVPESGITIHTLAPNEIGKLNSTEKQFLQRYLLSINENQEVHELLHLPGYWKKPFYITTGNLLYNLSPELQTDGRKSYIENEENTILTGPFPFPDSITLYSGNQKINSFLPEGGYTYTLREGFLKQKSWTRDPIMTNLSPFQPEINFKSHVLTPKEIDQWYHKTVLNKLRDYTFYRNNFSKHHPENKEAENYTLQLKLGNDKNTVDPLLIFFLNTDRAIRYVFSGSTRIFKNLPAATLDMVLLFEDSTYYQQNVHLRASGINYLALDSVNFQPQNHFSNWAFNFIQNELLQAIDSSNNAPVIPPSRDINRKGNQITGTICSAYEGHPLPGAIVQIKGIHKGTYSDINGYFSLTVPNEGQLEFVYVGCKKQVHPIIPGANYHIFLEDDDMALDEVVVVGRGTQRKATLVGAISSLPESYRSLKEINKLAQQDSSPFIILDGLPYSGNRSDIPTDKITSFRIVEPEKAVELYGPIGKNGMIVITTTTSGLKTASPLSQSLRHHFKDDAFWAPRLKSDQQGKVSFKVTYPDDITNWKAHFIAVGKGKQTGYATTSIKSFKAINAQLSLPSYAIQGDSLNYVGKLYNHLYDTITVERTISIDTISNQQLIQFSHSHIESIPLPIRTADSLSITYSLKKQDGYFDGEKQTLQILKAGIEETQGVFKIIDTDSLYTFHFPTDWGKITLHAETSETDIYLREIEKIICYAFDCNEQMASKLKALILQKRIFEALGHAFKQDRKINSLIQRLQTTKNQDGLWGWWKNNSTSLWITQQVIEALKTAANEGFKIQSAPASFTDPLLGLLQGYWTSTGELPKQHCLQILLLLKQLEVPIDYKNYINRLDKIKNQNLTEGLLTLRLKQNTGLPISVDSLMQSARQTLLGNLYWKNDYPTSENIVMNTSLAYHILRDMGDQNEKLSHIRNYFFEMYHQGYWQNTYETSNILEILLEAIDRLHLTTEQNPTLYLNHEKITAFPYTHVYAPNTELKVRKSGNHPIYFTAYQNRINPATHETDEGFQVKTYFIHQKDTLTTLKTGQATELEASVCVRSDAKFVRIEIPIPAGCSYTSKSEGNRSLEAHREYTKDKVSIFCPELKKGNYTFTVSLLPRFTGKFHINPARAELMYFPTFQGHEKMKEIEIK